MKFLRSASAFKATRWLLSAGLSIAALACGGDSGQPESSDSGTSPGNSTTRHIAWDQVAASLAEVRAYSFRLSVDGLVYGLTQVQCNAATPSGAYSCIAPLPSLSAGSHTLRMIAVYRGVESVPSAPITTVINATATGAEAATNVYSSGVTPSADAPARSGAFDVNALLTSDRPVQSIAALPDGRLLVIEDGSRISIVRNGERVTTPALVREHPLERLVGVQPSSDFEKTGALFVSSIDEVSAAQRSLVVRRYRELQGSLGEGAVVLTQSLGERGDPLVQLDIDDRIYVAVPSEQGGLVYRYAPDGRTPWSAGQSSPLLTSIDVYPKAMALHLDGGGLWLSGTNTAGTWRLLSVSLPNGGDASLDASIGLGERTTDPVDLVSMALDGGPQDDGSVSLFVNDGAGVVRYMTISGASVSTAVVPLPAGHRGLSVMGSRDHGAFAVLHNTASGSYTMARLANRDVSGRRE